MVQIPILSGAYADLTPALRTSYPVNMIPVPKDSGVSAGFLRPGDGIVQNGEGPGDTRGGIEWNGTCYRVMGSSLVTVSAGGAVTVLGVVGSDGIRATLDYSFDQLAIASNGNLYYWDGSALTQVTDPDLGTVLDMIWVDGFFMTTDGESLVVTDLNNPLAVNPLKYGSSEADPDPVIALLKIRNEPVAVNRFTMEFFDNIGGDLFPFQRIEGAQIEKGCVGKAACCVFLDAVAFLGGGRNEQVAIYLGANADTIKISTHEIDTLLEAYSDAELAAAELETRNEGSHRFLYVHLPDRSLVYDAGASQELKQPVWFTLTSTLEGFERYRGRHFVRCYDQWLCADETRLGYLTRDISSHWGEPVRWEFGTVIVFNEGRGALFHELELVSLTGSYAARSNTADVLLLEDGSDLLLEDGTTILLEGEVVVIQGDPVLWTQYSFDGVEWSSQRVISAGARAQRSKRLVWFGQGNMVDRRIQRFGGTSDCHASFARLEARLEPLAS